MIALMPAPADDRAGPGERPAAQPPVDRVHGPAPDLVRVALELPRLTVTRMAAELGIPRATLEAYRLGTRRMPPAVRARLGAYLTEHARMLRALADALRADALRGDALRGDALRGDALRGDASRGDASRGDASRGEPGRGA